MLLTPSCSKKRIPRWGMGVGSCSGMAEVLKRYCWCGWKWSNCKGKTVGGKWDRRKTKGSYNAMWTTHSGWLGGWESWSDGALSVAPERTWKQKTWVWILNLNLNLNSQILEFETKCVTIRKHLPVKPYKFLLRIRVILHCVFFELHWNTVYKIIFYNAKCCTKMNVLKSWDYEEE